ncbi:MAG: alpha-2-macroglobulin family protein [Devosia sp.]
MLTIGQSVTHHVHKAASAAAILFISAFINALPATADRALERLDNTDIPGGDYRTLRSVPLSQCESACLGDNQCRAFTYNERARWCFLKNQVAEGSPYQGATSAIVVDAGGPEPLPLPDLAFLPPDIATEANRLEAQISSARRTNTKVGAVTPAVATTLTAADTTDWLSFARTMLTTRFDSYSDRQQAIRAAGAAAYLGLRDARTPQEQGRALAVISAAMEEQGLFRPAIEASEASLSLALSRSEQDRLQRLRAQHGFRVLDYAVDSEARNPRLCIQFSEPIRGDAADVERFVDVDVIAAPTVSVENQQLCVEGLEHGGRYQVRVREGLDSTVGEALIQPADIRVYVRDRSAQARFESNRYVLPAGSRGIPVTTINTDSLDMRLYRINDRNLADVVRKGDFKRQLYSYEINEIAEESGAEAWKGTMAVDSVLNQEVTTLFPVNEVIGTVDPGVYVLTGVPSELANKSGSIATQWFVISDLGLSTFSGGDTVDVFVRSLETTAPTEGVEVTLLARNDEVLARGVSDADGHARLVSSAPVRGGQRPAVVTARSGEDDYAFISLAGAAFELTDRGVEGRTAPGPVDAFLTPERGVYRAGETVHLTVLVRDDNALALNDMPVTLKVVRPDGVVSRTILARADSAGGLAQDVPLTLNAATGTWQVSAHIDPEGPAVGTTTFLVEDFVPQRIEVDLATDEAAAAAGSTVEMSVKADFLYGAPASDMMIEGTVTLRQAKTIEGYDGYTFGLDTEPLRPDRSPLFNLPRTGPDGRATIAVPIADVADVTGAVEALVAINVREPGGRQVGDSLTLPVLTDNAMIGIKPLFDGSVGEGAAAGFDIIALNAARQRTIVTGAEWTLTRIERNFQWYRRNDRWFYESVERLERVDNGTLDIPAEGTASLSLPVDWGRYRLEVMDPRNGEVATSMVFSSGWVNTAANADTPDVLDVHLDKESYQSGETATLRISPRFAGKALVTVLAGTVRHTEFVDVPADGTTIPIAVDAAWAPGAYVTATLFRPAGVGDSPLPQRAVGLAHMQVDTAKKQLTVSIDAPDVAAPRQILSVPVTVDGLAPGESAYLTVAAVDVGILNITGFEPPDVDEFYLGQRRLGVELRDIYGDLIDAGSAARGRIRTGGDGIDTGSEALPPTQAPVSLFTGLITTDANGVATANFDVPAFNGTLRLMAIAWTETKVGDASADAIVRDPVVVAGSLPRFLAPGDATRMRFDVHNVSHEAGEYALSVAAMGPLSIDRRAESITLAKDQRASIELPVAATGVGEATIIATLTGPGDLSLSQDFTLVVRPAAAEVSTRRLVALSPGESATLSEAILDGFDNDATATLSVGDGVTDVAGLIQMLNRFPYGCAEQTVSRALPLLYLNTVAADAGLKGDTTIPERIDKAIERVLAYQSASGGFGLWSPGYDLWLTAYVMDFLTRAREAGYAVPAIAFDTGLDRLQSVLSYVGNLEGERGSQIAYATYVLARNGRAAIGDLRYFAEEKLDDFASPLARAQLAASLAFAGDLPLANSLFRNALAAGPATPRPMRTDFGTGLRDAAAILTLAAESRVGGGTVDALFDTLSEAKEEAEGRAFSTQEAAWLLLSANATQTDGTKVSVGGEMLTSPLARALSTDQLAGGLVVRNDGDQVVSVATTVRGTPLDPLPPVASGLTIERTYHTLDGEEVQPDQVRQNDRLLVRLTVTKTADAPMRILLSDLLPAGFEIENPVLVGQGAVASFPLSQSGQFPEHTEFRDDRFAAAWTLSQGATGDPLMVTYMVRAVSPGTFALPAAEVSDMYQPRYVARTASSFVAVVPTR